MDRWKWMLERMNEGQMRVDPAVLRLLEDQKRMEAVARQIRSLRKSQGLSQAALAKKVGSTQPSVARFEAGKVPNVGFAYVRRLLDALGAV